MRPPVNGHAIIEGTAGNLRLAEDGSIYLTKRGGVELHHDYVLPPGYRGGSAIATQQHFISCLRTGAAFETEGRDYLAIERAVEACTARPPCARWKKLVEPAKPFPRQPPTEAHHAASLLYSSVHRAPPPKPPHPHKDL